MNTVNSHTKKVQGKNKSFNQDIAFVPIDTSHGVLFVLLDFANHDYPSLDSTLPREVKPLIESLDRWSGLDSKAFLGSVAREINNSVLSLGIQFCGGNLFCVAAMCLLKGNQLHYLTYGDARINIYREGGGLLLLNGSDRDSPALIGAIDQSQERQKDTREQMGRQKGTPEQMGQRYLQSPLTDRVYQIGIEKNDIILLFSDGLEEGCSPQKRLDILRKFNSKNPKTISQDLIEATNSALDDRSITVVCPPYSQSDEPNIEQVNSQIKLLERRLGQHQQTEQQARNELAIKFAMDTDDVKRNIEKINSELNECLNRINKTANAKLDKNALQNSVREFVAEEVETIKKQAAPANRPINLSNFREWVVQDIDWLRSTLQGSKPSSVETYESGNPPPEPAKQLETRGAHFSLSWQGVPEDVKRVHIIYQPSDQDRRVAIIPTNYGKNDLKKEAVADIGSGEKIFTQFYMAEDYLKENRSIGGILRNWLGLNREQKLVSSLRAAVFILIGFMGYFGYQYLWHSSNSRPEEIQVRAAGKQLTLTYKGENGENMSLQLELAKSAPPDVGPQESFRSLKDLYSYLEKITKPQVEPPVQQPSIEANETEKVKIQSGDNLSKIAVRHKTTPQEVQKLNPQIDWSKLKEGEEIFVPRKSNN